MQYFDDLFYAEQLNDVMITDVVSLTLIDPEDYSVLSPGSLSSPYRLTLPLKDEAYKSNFFVVCSTSPVSFT